MTLFSKLFQRLTGRQPIGAFYFSDFEIRYLVLEGENLKLKTEFTLHLPKGVISEGIIQDKAALSSAVKQLVKQANFSRKTRGVVVSVDLSTVYSQIISFPTTPANIHEAILLNIRGVSPLPLEQSYLSYQELGVNSQTGEIDILITLVPRENIEAYLEVLSENDFLVIALEPPPFSILRYLRVSGQLDVQETCLVAYLSFGAIHFAVIENLQIKSIFHTKQNFEGKTLTQVQEIVYEEIKKFLSFYSSHHQKRIDTFLFSSQFFLKEIRSYLEKQLSQKVVTPSMRGNISDQKAFVYGAAIRGVFNPESDDELNILPFKPKKEHSFLLLLDFIEVWSIVYAVAAFIVISTLLGIYYYLGETKETVENVFTAQYSPVIEKQVENYNQQLMTLNKDLNLAQSYLSARTQWDSFFNEVQDLKAKGNIRIVHLQVGGGGNGQLTALAKNRDTAISFKNLFTNIKGINSVDLPIQTIQETAEGVSFLLNFSFDPKLIGTR